MDTDFHKLLVWQGLPSQSSGSEAAVPGAGLGLAARWPYYRGMTIDPARLHIIHYPDPVLSRPARPVEAVTDEICAVADRMLTLMHEAPGVGLAAPQVGLPWRMFVSNATGEADDDLVFINPELTDPSREMDELEEGCLSLPDIRGMVRRHIRITIHAVDGQGQPFALAGEALAARIWQHEYDHLDGVLIINRMAPIDRVANKRLIKELEEEYAAQGG